jgi:hypothetical protein
MQRSSESIGTIAGALAKAQLELTNPEKTLVATLRSQFPRESDRTFRYASLSSGLDIVRKTLGKYEIATVQTTAIDREAGLVRLTTILAHSSGEWVSSEWPICPVSEIAAPHKLGAALTYARRYALFTLAGIAGEDDLDAPDLPLHTNENSTSRPGGPGRMDGGSKERNPRRVPAKRNRSSRKLPSLTSVLSVEDSGPVRDKLVEEISTLASADGALAWAIRRIGMKNSLTSEDASIVDKEFQARIRVLVPDACVETSPSEPAAATEPASRQSQAASPNNRSADNEEQAPAREAGGKRNIERNSPQNANGFGLVKLRRSRNKDHLRFITLQPCTVCGRRPCEAHHIRYAQPRALGRKVSDEFTVPLCRVHHRELHGQGDERAWWTKFNIDPLPIALSFWQHTRGIQTNERASYQQLNSAVETALNMSAEQSSSEPLATRDNAITHFAGE